MAFDPAFLDELRARTPLSQVIGRRTRLVRSGRNWKACCPFHGEKSPSFYVYDDHYHCFGCGAHGDAISFVMHSQGASFVDAVKSLAAEAGLEVPEQAPRDREAEERRLGLADVLAAAQTEYRRRLDTAEGAPAREYLRRRGLSEGTIAGFGLGWSGDGRGGLVALLEKAGFSRQMIAGSGLMRLGEDGSVRGELFFNRVTFPIHDRRGVLTSFGGRLLGDGQPKYLNGPETALFSKRRTLFGLDRALAALRAPRPPGVRPPALLVVEGYMDVIALHQAGLVAVAPLGTALTSEQLELLWRAAAVPVLCFDGDAAGTRAARRAVEVALPLLTPERSLRIIRLPPGEDPDSMLRASGRAAFEPLLAAASPVSEALFDLLREGGEDSAEGRAAFRARLDAAASAIGDRALAQEVRSLLRDRFWTTFHKRPDRQPPVASRPRRGGGRGDPDLAPALIGTRPVMRPGGSDAERLRAMTAILLRHPSLLHDLEEAYAGLVLPEGLARLRAALFDWAAETRELDSHALMDHLHSAGLAPVATDVLASSPYPLPSEAREGAMPAEAAAGWWHFFALVSRHRLDAEVDAARAAMSASFDAASERRLVALCAAREALARGEQGEDA